MWEEFFYFSEKWFIKMLHAESEKNLRRFVGRFSNVRLPAVHAASDRLQVNVPQASSDPALQLILRFGLPATPVNVCLQESPKVLNWASLGDKEGFISGAARTGYQARFPQPDSLPLLLSWSTSTSGLLALVVSAASHQLPSVYDAHKTCWCWVSWPKSLVTHQHCRTPVSPAGSCSLWGIFSGFRPLPLFLSNVSPLSNLSKIKTAFSWKLPNSPNVSQQMVSPSLLLTCQNCPMAFLLSI